MIREDDARTLVRILSKVAAMDGTHEDKKRALM